MKTFGEITTIVAGNVQRTTDAEYITKIQYWINLAQIKAVNLYDFWQALQTSLTMSSVNAQEQYYLPSDFDKPYRIYDLTNDKKLSVTTREEYFDANISNIANSVKGTPQWAMFYGINAIAKVTTGSFTIQVKSSSANDTAGGVVRIEGWIDAAKTLLGYTNITISTSTPTTYISDPSAIGFYGITRVTKSINTTGFITIADNSGNILATIAPVDRESRYPVMFLGLIPSGVFNYQMLYKKRVKKMVDNNDYPFTEGIEDYIIMESTGYAYNEEKETADRAAMVFSKAKELLDIQINNEQNKLGVSFQHKVVPQTLMAHRA